MDIQKSNTDETFLISRIRNGDTQAYKILYDDHVELLFRFLKQFRKNDSEVQELVQRAFIKAFEGLASFNYRSKFKTWLFQIALNEMRSDIRRNSIIPFVDIDAADESVSESNDESFEWNSTLKTLFDQLDETKRAVFMLYEVEGYSHSEIAVLLNIGESTSRTILTRTKQWLRNQLNVTRSIQ
ncbi:MAG: sigma-70 family RNA polymerase sigma factor [Bacteriovoracaceae bacterium]|nr:sigma-70 family RNA polymerase sigma factor [Bacteroidota bacterium]